MPNNEESEEILRIRQQRIHETFTYILNFADSVDPWTTIEEMGVRLETLNDAWQEYNFLYDRFALLMNESFTTQAEKYHKAKAIFLLHMKNRQEELDADRSNA